MHLLFGEETSLSSENFGNGIAVYISEQLVRRKLYTWQIVIGRRYRMVEIFPEILQQKDLTFVKHAVFFGHG